LAVFYPPHCDNNLQKSIRQEVTSEERGRANLSVELVGRFSVSLSKSWSREARWVSLNHLHLTNFEYTLKILHNLSGSDIG
jgi:hypothetical protein